MLLMYLMHKVLVNMAIPYPIYIKGASESFGCSFVLIYKFIQKPKGITQQVVFICGF